MRGEILGVERRRYWGDDEKLAIVSAVGVGGATVPVSGWHQMIGEPSIADAIFDRIIHNAHRIEVKGDSMRRKSTKPDLTQTVTCPPEVPSI